MSARASVVDERFCGRGEALSGQVAVADLVRLRGETAKADGALCYEVAPLRFGGKSAVEMRLRGSVWLTCQRCLGDFEAQLSARRVLVFAPPPADLEEEGEATDFVGAETHFEVLALVEDEALLSLPMVPRHLANECPADAPAGPLGNGSGGLEGREATEKH